MLNLPNVLTTLRGILIPFVFVAHAHELRGTAIGLFAVILLTDYFDGKLARYLNQTTAFGSILDPVMDKAVDISFVLLFASEGGLPRWYALLVIFRNVAQLLSIPVLLWMMKIHFKVKPAPVAKFATALCFFIFFACFLRPFHSAVSELGTQALVPVSAMLEVYILATYIPRFIQIATGKHDTFE